MRFCKETKRMASSANHQEATAATAATATVAGPSTNQSLTGNQNHLAIGSQRQQQQQELIRLLAQHFHHQFYQMSNSCAVNQGGHFFKSIPAATATTTATASRLQQPNIAAHFNHQSNQYEALRDAATSFSQSNLRAETNCLNLFTGNNSSQQQFLANHLLRSQQQQLQQPTGSSGGGQPLGGPESFVDHFSAIQNPSNVQHPLLGDSNILSALGLNLTNNQLVLSLQQQSLIQAAAAARHYETSRHEANQIHHQQQRHQQQLLQQQPIALHQQFARGKRKSADVNSAINNQGVQEADIDIGEARTEQHLLKFSINTILGRGSPKSTSSINDELRLGEDGKIYAQSDGGNGKSRGGNRDMTECDLGDDYSDSSIVTTPTPQGTSNSSLFSHTNAPIDNHSANMSGIPQATPITPSSVGDQSTNSIRRNQQVSHAPLSFLASSTAFPWTVAARGKPRRGMMRRAVFSDSQRVGLEKRFQLQKYISKPDRKKLAEKLGLRDSQVKIWFQNRRMKWRNSKERELLSAGGSREQTLPTRNNPNPDLSDVGETIKRLTSTVSGSTGNNNNSLVK